MGKESGLKLSNLSRKPPFSMVHLQSSVAGARILANFSGAFDVVSRFYESVSALFVLNISRNDHGILSSRPGGASYYLGWRFTPITADLCESDVFFGYLY